LHVPSAFVRKSGHEQKLTPGPVPRIATRYVRPLAGFVTRKSENTGAEPTFSRRKACSRPCWRRSPACHSSTDSPSGAWCRESFAASPRRRRLAATRMSGLRVAHLPFAVQPENRPRRSCAPP
jgi:hypothetical protein